MIYFLRHFFYRFFQQPFQQLFMRYSLRQRAYLKLGTFGISTLMFVMLACMSSPPPPFYIGNVDGDMELLPGNSQDVTFTPSYRNDVLEEGTKIEIVTSHYPTEALDRELDRQILFVDAKGEISAPIVMPDNAKPGDSLRVQFNLFRNSERPTDQTTISFNVLPEITIRHLNPNSVWESGPVTNLLVQVFDNREQHPIANARWQAEAYTGPREMDFDSSGTTDENGFAQIRVDLSDGPVWEVHYGLEVSVETERGTFEASVDGFKGAEAFDVLVSTDKPIYQPGQTIHVRALALLKTSMKAAADQGILVRLVDPKGNIISEQQGETSDYGIASLNFPLDSQIMSGDYTLRAETAFGVYNRTVEVKPYILPRFEIIFDSDQSFYASGDTVSGTIDATYFFGKPVTEGMVQITGFAPEISGSPDMVEIISLVGETDKFGRYRYEFVLPDTLVGQEAHDSVQIDLEITVIDAANHAEEVEEQVIVAQQSLLFDAIAESGELETGVENIVYIQASTPDGRPARESLTVEIDGQSQSVETDSFGLATVLVNPASNASVVPMTIQAQDISQTLHLQTNWSVSQQEEVSLLLRPSQAEIAVGDPLALEVLVATDQDHARSNELVLIEVSKQGYLYHTDAVMLQGGRAVAMLQLDPSLIGTIQVSAYLVSHESNYYNSDLRGPYLAGDQRLVLVNPTEMEVDLTTDARDYRPGDTATLDVQIAQDDRPIQGMLGISIVDESVFALGAQDPAFARTYFLIDKELTNRHYGINGFAPFGGEPSPYVTDKRFAAAGGLNHRSEEVAAQQTALFGALAQELQWTKSVQASATLPTSAHVSESAQGAGHAIPVGFFFTVLAICVGRRNRKQTLWSIAVILVSTLLWTACASAPMAPAAESGGADMADAASEEMAASDGFRETGGSILTEQSAAKPRLRQFFPETLIWLPEVETDADGRAQIEVPIADSITTWRISLIASDKEGHLGSAQLPMRVFQDFFVEPSLPLFLTEGDEIDVPISVFNYLDKAQTIELEIGLADWFELLSDETLSVDVAANEVTSIYIPIRVLESGIGDFKLTATGSAMSDAVLRQVNVQVNGQHQNQVINGTLHEHVVHQIHVDERSLADESTVTVKFYPSIMSEIVSSLEGMLREPNGCFEQTSSINYPNVMILDYLRTTGQAAPAIEQRASRFVNRGYQRLLGFEVGGHPGGFSIYGDPPPQIMLTAYGLMQFNDQSRVTYVDPALLARIAEYLVQNQNSDGSWDPEGRDSGGIAKGDDHRTVAPTAYIVWALAEAGVAEGSVEQGIAYLREALDQQQVQSNYGLAMVVNALIAAGASEQEVEPLLERLIHNAAEAENNALFWNAGRSTYLGGYADAADVETSAMVAIALLRAGYRIDIAARAIEGLQAERGPHGYYYSTQATVLALKALTLSQQWDNQDDHSVVTAIFNGEKIRTFDVASVENDRPVELMIPEVNLGQNEILIETDGERPLSYQIVTESYLSWDRVLADAADPENQSLPFAPALELDISYDQSEVNLNETVTVKTEMKLLSLFSQWNLMAEIGLPPGFRPVASDLDKLVSETDVADYEIRADKVVLYIAWMVPDQTYTFQYRLMAQVPGMVQAPPSFGYPYYASNLRTIDGPQTLLVARPSEELAMVVK